MKETPISKDSLAQKLRALQNITVANGCTESEALVAAAKAAELLERYGLSLEELKAAGPDQVCDCDSVNCGRRHTHKAQFLAPKKGRGLSRYRQNDSFCREFTVSPLARTLLTRHSTTGDFNGIYPLRHIAEAAALTACRIVVVLA